MSIVRLRHVDRFTDRHGRVRYYFRRGKGKRLALPGKPGADAFMLAYQAALAGEEVCKPIAHRSDPGSFARLVQDYYASSPYLGLKPVTQHTYRLMIDRLLGEEKIGHRLVAQMTRQHVQQIMGRRAATPAYANNFLKIMKILLHFAIDHGWRRDDPTLRIKRFREGEFHTWTDEEIARFEARWPIGSRERTAFALFLFTGQRLSDVVGMGWQDVEDGAIRVVQQKTGAKLWIPLHPELRRVLASWSRKHALMLTTKWGNRFSAAGFGSYMAKSIEAAGLPERCVSHGLRKAAARRLAEAGCSANEIAAVTGHATLEEVARYTKAAEQKKLAKAAMERLGRQDANKNSQT